PRYPSAFHSLTHHPPTSPSYSLSLHDALPISWGLLKRWMRASHFFMRTILLALKSARIGRLARRLRVSIPDHFYRNIDLPIDGSDRKSTRLNSSHVKISYAVFCLKKKRRIKE